MKLEDWIMKLTTSLRRAVATVLILAPLAVPASARDVVTREDGKTIVDAPTTKVVTRERDGATRVKVRAPATKVDVDTERGHVRIRVPGYSGDIRW